MISKLKALAPTEFENLTYDLLSLSGIKNLVWRTPGADGGRDLEGMHTRIDFAGGVVSEIWYVECKRYQSAIDWPTVYGKIAYASNHEADYLLFVTTSSLSPRCIDEVTQWNAYKKRPILRHWPGHHLAELISLEPRLRAKYKLVDAPVSAISSISLLSQELAKVVQASHSSEEFANSLTPNIEFAAALADLLTACVDDIERDGKVNFRPFRNAIDGFPWLAVRSADLSLDRLAGRAFFTAIHILKKGERLILTPTGGELELRYESGTVIEVPATLQKLLNEICFWGDMENRIAGGTIILRRR